jgi:hypothetical protein
MALSQTTIDVSVILGPVVAFATATVSLLLNKAADKFVAVMKRRLDLDLSAKQVQAVHDAMDTASGVVTAMLTKGEMQLKDVHVANPQVQALVQLALAAVPAAAAATGITPDYAAHMVVGRVGNMLGADPATQTVPPVLTPQGQIAPQQIAPLIAAQVAAAATPVVEPAAKAA